MGSVQVSSLHFTPENHTNTIYQIKLIYSTPAVSKWMSEHRYQVTFTESNLTAISIPGKR